MAVLATSLPLLTATASAQTTSWTGAGGSSWSDDGNWDSGAPDASSQAVIDSLANAPILDGQAGSAATVTIGDGADGALTLQNDAALQVSGEIVIGSQGGSSGTLAIGQGGAAGTVTAAGIRFGDGDGEILFDHNQEIDFAPAITGGGSLGFLAGTTRLTGSNSYTGGTSIAGGAILVGDADSLGGSIANAGTLVFDQAGEGEFFGTISGAGDVRKTGAGLLQLHGVHGYDGTTQLEQGGLAVLDALESEVVMSDGTFLSVAGELEGVVTGGRDTSVTVLEGGSLHDRGSHVILVGSGGIVRNHGWVENERLEEETSIKLTGEGAELINTGTIIGVGGGGVLLEGSRHVVANDGLIDSQGFYALIVEGSGHRLENSGTIRTALGEGVFVDSRPGEANVIHNSGTIEPAGGSFAVVGADGDETLVNAGTILGAVDLGGGDDTLEIHDGMVLAGYVDGGTGTNSLVLGGPVGGSFDLADLGETATYRNFQEVVKDGASDWTLTGSNAALTLQVSEGELRLDGAVGGATIAGGTLVVGDGGQLLGDITNDGTLVFDDTGDRDLAGALVGSGRLFKKGPGTLSLAGANSFSGNTTVEAGTLLVNGRIGTVTLMAGAVLGGAGEVGQVVAAGRIAPGNSIGTLSTGPVTFQAGSVYLVEIADNGTADRLEVTGKATIEPGAALEVSPLPGNYQDGQRYTVIATSEGVEGSFDTLGYAAGQSLTFDLSLLTEGRDLVLLLGRNRSSFLDLVGNPTLQGAAAALDALEARLDASGDALLQALFALGDEAALEEAVRQISGSGLAGAAETASAGSLAVLRQLSGPRLQAGAPGGTALAPALTQFALGEGGATDLAAAGSAGAAAGGEAPFGSATVWLRGVGGFGSRDGDGSVDGQSRRFGGIAGGLRGRLAEDLEVGLALARLEGRTETDDDLVRTDNRSLLAALHGSWSPGDLRLEGALGVARHRFESERRIAFSGFEETASGDRLGHEVVADLGATWDWRRGGGLTVSPTAGLSFSWMREEDWRESGADSANLAIEETDTLAVLPRAGVGLSYSLSLGPGLELTPQGQALWLGRFGDSHSDYGARFVAGGPGWDIPAADEPRHSAAVGVGAVLRSDEGWSLAAGYAGRFAGGAQDHGFLLGGSLRF